MDQICTQVYRDKILGIDQSVSADEVSKFEKRSMKDRLQAAKNLSTLSRRSRFPFFFRKSHITDDEKYFPYALLVLVYIF